MSRPTAAIGSVGTLQSAARLLPQNPLKIVLQGIGDHQRAVELVRP